MYSDYRIYGPYVNKDKRKRIVLVSKKDCHQKTSVSYPKYLVETSIGRYLNVNEQIHHKDGDFSNDEISNLEIVKLGKHQRLHNPPKVFEDKLTKCFWCHKLFLMTKKHQFHRRAKRTQNRPGPFCSRKCSGKYGQSIQAGTLGMNLLKFGETFANGNAEPSLKIQEGVETRREASRTDEGIVQRTNIERWRSKS